MRIWQIFINEQNHSLWLMNYMLKVQMFRAALFIQYLLI